MLATAVSLQSVFIFAELPEHGLSHNLPTITRMVSEDTLQQAIEHAAQLLPAQGPITVFIHHNTLHAFEHLPFEEAVRRGHEAFGCEPYLTESRFRHELARGRILEEDLESVLRAENHNRQVADRISKFELRRVMMRIPWIDISGPELEYNLAENGLLARLPLWVPMPERQKLLAETRRWALQHGREYGVSENWTEAQWEAFAVGQQWRLTEAAFIHAPDPSAAVKTSARYATTVRRLTGNDPDVVVHERLIRFTAAYLDQGCAEWLLPGRNANFLNAFSEYVSTPGFRTDIDLRLQEELSNPVEAIESVRQSLEAFGITEKDRPRFLDESFLALRGWAGIIREVATRADRVVHAIPAGTLTDFLAVRLLLDRCVGETLLREHGAWPGSWTALKKAVPTSKTGRRGLSHRLVQVAQALGWGLPVLSQFTPAQWSEWIAAVEEFGSLERRRLFQLAYERRFRVQTLDLIMAHSLVKRSRTPVFQIITCLDEREESFRRHLEEIEPECETHGAAGFFNIPMYHRGRSDAHFTPLCPIVLTPGHWVEERAVNVDVSHHDRQKRVWKAIGAANLSWNLGSRKAGIGALATTIFGPLATAPLVGRILFPRLTARIGDWLGRRIARIAPTRLALERCDLIPSPQNGGIGFSIPEMADMSERFLRDIGLIDGFSRLVVVLGHGSGSVNNPHRSAYDCGACGGSPGAPNSRALAQMLNDPRVRRIIAERGIVIPESTWFLGGFHNTGDDNVSLSDADLIPASHQADLKSLQELLEEAGRRNAHERCRRFMSAPLTQTTAEALRHVQNRTVDLAQVRPELGHATNAICYVGRRDRVRGLYFDRRAFLASYDPTQDDADGSTLARILSAAVPVCGGINLEYYFSHVDNRGYGSGTKLPHNVTSHLGVMDGAASDLRTGLPWQMVEIHEPVRLLFVVESEPDILLAIMNRNPDLSRMVRNVWVQMTLLDPSSQGISIYDDGHFEIYKPSTDRVPTAQTSQDWYRGWRDHLEFARLDPGRLAP